MPGKLDELMELVGVHDLKPQRFAAARSARLIELHRDIIDLYRLVSHDRERAEAFDRSLDDHIKAHGGGSALRDIILQLHAVFFEMAISVLGRRSAAYKRALTQRPPELRTDALFLQRFAAPLLLDPVNAPMAFPVRFELLKTIARFLIAYKVRPSVGPEAPVEEVVRLPRNELVLLLVRRWEENPDPDVPLIAQANSLENKLHGDRHFKSLEKDSRILGEILGKRGLNYLPRDRPWMRVKRFLARAWDRLVELAPEGPHLPARRAGLYYAIGLVFLALAVAFAFYLHHALGKMRSDLDGWGQWPERSRTSAGASLRSVPLADRPGGTTAGGGRK